ncbi:MAG: hypothetical protein ACR2HG_04705 [Pyrinomonadaceae bacterium]
MLLFIVIFFAMIIAVSISAIVGFSVYLRRKTKSLKSENQKQFADVPPYRSLFEPDDEEIRASEREAQMRVEAERKEAERKVLFEKSEKVREFEKIWRGEPTKQNTIELLRLAAISESAEVFSQTAENVIQVWRENKIENLTSTDLADLLDSHFRTLPQQERISGALFWIKQEIERLRGNSE